MKFTQCQLPGHIFMFETPLEVAAQLLRQDRFNPSRSSSVDEMI
jgi:hypothetical protein